MSVPLAGQDAVELNVSGSWSHGGGRHGADGQSLALAGCGSPPPCTVNPVNGPLGSLSGLSDRDRFWYLVGIFVGDTLPETAPPSLDFTGNHDFAEIAPALGQAFFVGDGRTGSGGTQRFDVPTGATRLLLGMADICGSPVPDCYFDNSGTLTVSLGPTSVTCLGRPATIVGTAGDDTITGTAGDDVIVGGGGNDTIDGAGGDDVICGGAGNDAISGGDGNDQIAGGGGNDVIDGGPGDDRLLGGHGDDTLDGAGGTDKLRGGLGADTCLSGEILNNCETTS